MSSLSHRCKTLQNLLVLIIKYHAITSILSIAVSFCKSWSWHNIEISLRSNIEDIIKKKHWTTLSYWPHTHPLSKQTQIIYRTITIIAHGTYTASIQSNPLSPEILKIGTLGCLSTLLDCWWTLVGVSTCVEVASHFAQIFLQYPHTPF
jgi:hypothetical protein